MCMATALPHECHEEATQRPSDETLFGVGSGSGLRMFGRLISSPWRILAELDLRMREAVCHTIMQLLPTTQVTTREKNSGAQAAANEFWTVKACSTLATCTAPRTQRAQHGSIKEYGLNYMGIPNMI